ncbi:MAG: hypothetical protein KatS3mg051_0698 [Anaerolineae bacterium]|nr:MAG: hypothetical protein KatS3mg051_0698 [Anaerolineae bacterium]
MLIDPAVCYAHREMDLAMSELFGGYAPRFYEAYFEAFPRARATRNGARSISFTTSWRTSTCSGSPTAGGWTPSPRIMWGGIGRQVNLRHLAGVLP